MLRSFAEEVVVNLPEEIRKGMQKAHNLEVDGCLFSSCTCT